MDFGWKSDTKNYLIKALAWSWSSTPDMSQNLFSVTIFFVVFREALETAVIISALLSLVKQLVHEHAVPSGLEGTQARTALHTEDETTGGNPPLAISDPESDSAPPAPRVLKKLRLQIILGSFVGLAISLALGGTFIALWFTQANNLWSKSKQLWEGTFQLVASLMILFMGITLLKMEGARTKWRVKLQNAFSGKQVDRSSIAGKWVLFLLPMVTVLREGLESVLFVAGVAIGQPASSIPIPTIVGIICGLACGFVIYQSASRTTLKIFLIFMSNLLLLIGAGLFSRAVWEFQEYAFFRMLGANEDDSQGTGPGSYDVRGNVWHLDCCSSSSGGWSLFKAIFGWQNSATLGSVLSYVFYWLVVIAILIYFKFKEGRTKIFGWESTNGKRKREQRKGQETLDVSTEKSGREMASSS